VEKESIIRVSLEDEKLSEAVYQAQGKRHRRSRTRGRRRKRHRSAEFIEFLKLADARHPTYYAAFLLRCRHV
jgi:hypothetical protein